MLAQRRRVSRLAIAILAILGLTSLGLRVHNHIGNVAPRHLVNWWLSIAPPILHGFPLVQTPRNGPCDPIDEILLAPHPSTFSPPALTRPVWDKEGRLTSPALIKLHTFSITGNFVSRDFLRQVARLGIPEPLRHLVEFNFVLGKSQDPQEEAEADAEQEIHGDLLRLDMDENMNNGKSYEWIKKVWETAHEPGGRHAQWIMKQDEDTLMVLPAFLSVLQSLDPTFPTYLGTTLGRWIGFYPYMQGMGYLLDWGTIGTLASANLPESKYTYQWDEDAFIGQLLFSLPSKPELNQTLDQMRAAKEFTQPIPHSLTLPHERTGLVRIDMGRLLGNWHEAFVIKSLKTVGLHDMKTQEDYLAVLNMVLEVYERNGIPYEWDPSRGTAALTSIQ